MGRLVQAFFMTSSSGGFGIRGIISPLSSFFFFIERRKRGFVI